MTKKKDKIRKLCKLMSIVKERKNEIFFCQAGPGRQKNQESNEEKLNIKTKR